MRAVSICSAAWLLGLGLLPAMTAGAADWRIETGVFVGRSETPSGENLTLFADGVVYDFLLTEPEEITIFDHRRGQFVLLDTARKVSTTIDTDDLLKFTARLKVRAAKGGPLVRFAADPDFTERFDRDSNTLTLAPRKTTNVAVLEC